MGDEMGNNSSFKKNRCARGARFHMMISDARSRGLPGKLAWVSAVVTVCIMSVCKFLAIGTPEIVPTVLIFFVCALFYQVGSRIVFAVLEAASRPAYERFITEEDRYNECGSSYRHYHTSYEDVAEDEPCGAYEKARALFQLSEPYTVDALRTARNKMIKRERLHPDEGGSEERFKAMMQAYDLLMSHVE